MREKELILKELNETAEKLRVLADELKDCAMSLDLAWKVRTTPNPYSTSPQSYSKTYKVENNGNIVEV